MKKANILLDDQSTGLTIIEKMDFDSIDNIHGALLFAFHPEELGDDEDFDDRFIALWHIFLATVGWTDDEFWAEYKSRSHQCPKCEAEKNKSNGENKSEEDSTPPELKSN